MQRTFLALGALVLATTPLTAQADHHQHSPYADQPGSGIASLSLQELEDLRSGAGMGFARAAELNHYPGPKHVLELADSLGLTPVQKAQVNAVFEAMHSEATRLGEQIIEAERTLSRRFEHGHIDSATVRTATAEIGGLMAELRYVHLTAHLALRNLLTQEQVATYDRLRGYAAPE